MTIHAHEYKPRAVWRRKGRQDKSRLFLGFELEVEILEDENDPCDCCRKRDCHGCEKLYRDTPQGVARMLEERLGHRDPKGPFVYFKDDGSINCGFEMVSHPMTYGWIRSHRRLLKRALRLLRWRNADAASNCGLHVHVSRAALSQNTIDRMVDFVYDNPGFIERISRRDPDDLYEWAAVHLENEFIRVMVLPEMGGRIHVGRDKTNGYDFIYRQDAIKPALPHAVEKIKIHVFLVPIECVTTLTQQFTDRIKGF